MASIPTRRILATHPCLRAASIPGASSYILRATFSSAATRVGAPQQQRQQLRRQPPRTYTPLRTGVRWSSISATGSKIWTFEEIQSLSSQDPPKPTLIDVREPHELGSTGRIPGAVNIPITTSPDSFHITPSEFEERFGYDRPEKDAEVVFYCKAGVRSRAAAGLAREAGWTNVGEYPGSWNEWSGKGGDVEK
ncbi:Rhodanese-like domain-containing protein [Xylaria flabelliformis]|nr:Rhodanese-like domain-containing protein [Xylaria flabelliformis]